MNRSPKTIPTVSQKQKLINQYFSNAYAVYAGQKTYQVIGKVALCISRKTGYKRYENISVKNSFFDKVIAGHPNIFRQKQTGKVNTQRLFQFITTVNIPDEVRQAVENNRLYFLKKITNQSIHLVIIDKDDRSPVTNSLFSTLITDFSISPNKRKRIKYLEKIKNTSREVFSNSGETPTAYLSSDVLSQVPGTGGR